MPGRTARARRGHSPAPPCTGRRRRETRMHFSWRWRPLRCGQGVLRDCEPQGLPTPAGTAGPSQGSSQEQSGCSQPCPPTEQDSPQFCGSARSPRSGVCVPVANPLSEASISPLSGKLCKDFPGCYAKAAGTGPAPAGVASPCPTGSPEAEYFLFRVPCCIRAILFTTGLST